MASKLLFAGKTAIVTGAGGGLGRAYAMELAKRGASVVVNDLGGSLDGQGSNSTAAQKVVDEITSGGGKAIANYDNVVDGSASIVEATLKNFGQVDLVVNNAGILRDKSFHKATKVDWDAVIDVHLHGTANMCREVWPLMMEAKTGRIINVGSAAGLYGNFGQANYSAAKMGILGLTNTLAVEGKKHNIGVNSVCPIAASRMTETVGLPKAVLDMLEPEHVVPLVVYLAHTSTDATGRHFEVGGGWYSEVKWARSAGTTISPSVKGDKAASAEDVAAKFKQICTFDSGSHSYPTSPSDAFQSIMAAKAKGAFSGFFGS
jgi:NAD(P)-dependent dehydrogenase (short-subunit alcohol dehydrogenase family)